MACPQKPSAASAWSAALRLQNLLLATVKQPQRDSLQEPDIDFRQKDGRSCGFWVLAYLDREWRQFLAEAPQAVDLDLRSERLNKWIQALLRSREAIKLAKQMFLSVGTLL